MPNAGPLRVRLSFPGTNNRGSMAPLAPLFGAVEPNKIVTGHKSCNGHHHDNGEFLEQTFMNGW